MTADLVGVLRGAQHGGQRGAQPAGAVARRRGTPWTAAAAGRPPGTGSSGPRRTQDSVTSSNSWACPRARTRSIFSSARKWCSSACSHQRRARPAHVAQVVAVPQLHARLGRARWRWPSRSTPAARESPTRRISSAVTQWWRAASSGPSSGGGRVVHPLAHLGLDLGGAHAPDQRLALAQAGERVGPRRAAPWAGVGLRARTASRPPAPRRPARQHHGRPVDARASLAPTGCRPGRRRWCSSFVGRAHGEHERADDAAGTP